MSDMRVVRTKKNIRNALINLLQNTSFEKISVTELCQAAEVSRITFYTYYEDKYALVEEMYNGYIVDAFDDYHALQKMNNPTDIPLLGYYNLLECILDLYIDNLPFFRHVNPVENPYLSSVYFNHIFQYVESYFSRHPAIKTKYSHRSTATFICNGFWGLISSQSHNSEELTRGFNEIRAIYHDILDSSLFVIGEEGQTPVGTEATNP